MMFFSTFEVRLKELVNIKKYVKNVLVNSLINYGLLTSLIIFLSMVFVKDLDLRFGFILMASMPPAVLIVPLSKLLKGNVNASMFSIGVLYLASLVISPFLLSLFLPVGHVALEPFLKTLLITILLPLFLANLFSHINFFRKTTKYHVSIINFSVFLILYILIGINQSIFLKDFRDLFIVSGICFARTFLSGFLTLYICTWLGIGRDDSISYMLFGSYKNLSLTAVIASLIFNERAAIPAIVGTIFEITFIPSFILLQNFIVSGGFCQTDNKTEEDVSQKNSLRS